VQSGTNCTIQEIFNGSSKNTSAINIKTIINLEENAHCDYQSLPQTADQNSLLITHTVNVNAKPHSQFTTLQILGKLLLIRYNFIIKLQKNATFDAKAIYVINQVNQVDLCYNVRHIQSHTYSNVNVRGIAGDSAKASFIANALATNGITSVKAFQNNKNIQLSPQAEINTKPSLQIYTDDICCRHGATIGQLDHNALFYLQTRGIDKYCANKLLINAFLTEMLDHPNHIDALEKLYTDVYYRL
jgi:Fe-S cluster assembly protein SufD